jgi:NADPH:quinone reductase-like Zn-dependent oxidoreductase
VRALAIADRTAQPSLLELPVVEPGPGQLRVDVQAASVNGFDAAVAAGYVWDAMPHTFPVVLGRDFAGTVAAVGAGVARPEAGTRVLGVVTGPELGTGAIGESITVDADSVVEIPAGVSWVQAAAVGLAGVAASVTVSALAPGSDDVVLVSGATGGVGAFAVQLAAHSGAHVLATAHPGAAQFVTGLGAESTVDHAGDLAAQVQALAPAGLSGVIHLAGDAAALGALLSPGGRLVSAVGASPEQVGRDDVSVVSVRAAATSAMLSALLQAVADGTLSVPVERTYGLADAATALADFGSPKLGKLVVTTS